MEDGTHNGMSCAWGFKSRTENSWGGDRLWGWSGGGGGAVVRDSSSAEPTFRKSCYQEQGFQMQEERVQMSWGCEWTPLLSRVWAPSVP